MEHLLNNLEELREKIIATKKLLAIDRKEAKARELRVLSGAPDFWQDQAKAVSVSRESEELEKEVKKWNDLQQEVRQLEELTAMANLEQTNNKSQSLSDDLHKQYEDLLKKFNDLEFFVLFAGRYDAGHAIISIHAGTGGVDAQDWTAMLERMFFRFCEKHDWLLEEADRQIGNEAGLKSVTFKVSGLYAYGYLKGEAGVHRLVRISPFDGEGMRHTSFALVEVLPDLPDDEPLDIKSEDLKVDFFRSSGPGGQSVNKTSSAVRLTYLPNGLTVAAQSERSQHQNRELAMKILKAKLHRLQSDKRADETASLKGGNIQAAWGKQIRSYVLQPYQLVKDHRTGYETSDVQAVLDGQLEGFIEAYIRHKKAEN